MTKKTAVINRMFWSVLSAALFLPTIIARAASTGQVPKQSVFKLKNPIGAESFQELIQKMLGVMLDIGVPIATLFIIYSGFLFVKAQGNPEKLKEAKETFFWTIVGTAVLLGAWVLAQAIKGTIESLK
ncbi:MAG: hypothetical protein HYT28_03035 [Parcubacteria group bacterium]|nr:hypothetical protein [Parcubacteria group bacterium]